MNARALAALLGVLATGCGESGPVLIASEGGRVTSDDGVLTLVFPPGALPADTAISIRALGDDAWPVDAPGRFTRIGGVYQVEPAGLQLAADAYAVVIPPSPDLLVGAGGGDVLAAHYVWSPTDDKVRPAPVSRTWRLADGRVAVVGTLYELGTHWVGERVPGADRALVALEARVETGSLEAAVGETFAVTALSLVADIDHALFGRQVRASVVRTSDDEGAAPQAGAAWTSDAWDATVDPDLGLHPLEIFGAGARTEHLARYETPEPLTLEAGVAVDPLTPELPTWTCERAVEDAGSVWVGVDVVTGASAGVVTVGVLRELGVARCR